jgi:hypothetical protein
VMMLANPSGMNSCQKTYDLSDGRRPAKQSYAPGERSHDCHDGESEAKLGESW